MFKSIALLALLTSGISAQSATAAAGGTSGSGLPSCATSCLSDGIQSSGCSASDIACICESQSFIEQLTPCVESSCSASELETVIQYAVALCGSASVSLDVGAIESGAGVATASSVSSIATEISEASASTTAAVTVTSGAANTTAANYSTPVTTRASASTGGSSGTASTSATDTASANGAFQIGAGTAGAGLLALVAYLF